MYAHSQNNLDLGKREGRDRSGHEGKSLLFSVLPHLCTRHKIVVANISIAALRLPDPTDMPIKWYLREAVVDNLF